MLGRDKTADSQDPDLTDGAETASITGMETSNNILSESRKQARNEAQSQIPETMAACRKASGKTWWTVTEMVNQLENDLASYTGEWRYQTRRRQMEIVRGVFEKMRRCGKAERCLGSDDGREVRVYALRNW